MRGRFATAVALMSAVLAAGCGGAVATAPRASGGAETVLSSNLLDRGEQLVVKMAGQELSLYSLSWYFTGSGKRTCYGHCAKMFLPLIDRGRIVVANPSCHGPRSCPTAAGTAVVWMAANA